MHNKTDALSELVSHLQQRKTVPLEWALHWSLGSEDPLQLAWAQSHTPNAMCTLLAMSNAWDLYKLADQARTTHLLTGTAEQASNAIREVVPNPPSLSVLLEQVQTQAR